MMMIMLLSGSQKLIFKTASHVDGMFYIQMEYEEVEMNKPIFVGTSVLDLSKVTMMNFHYNVIDKNFHGNHSVLYSDTDSLVYEIRNQNVFTWITNNKEYFDLSETMNPKMAWLKDDTNKKRLGCMKDENNGYMMKEWTAVSPKGYSAIADTRDKEITIQRKSRELVRQLLRSK